jgi:GTP-binding protein
MKITSAKFLVGANSPAAFPQDHRPEIAFLGRSNVGKSSLINSLLGIKKLAWTSARPGRTQTINFYLINESFYFVDLPGYGYARASQQARRAWGRLVEKYLAQRPQLVLSMLVVDARHEPSPLDLQMKSWLQHFGLPYLVVSTKIDKLSANQRRLSWQRAKKSLGTERIILYSAITCDGAAQVWEVIQASIIAKGTAI